MGLSMRDFIQQRAGLMMLAGCDGAADAPPSRNTRLGRRRKASLKGTKGWHG